MAFAVKGVVEELSLLGFAVKGADEEPSFLALAVHGPEGALSFLALAATVGAGLASRGTEVASGGGLTKRPMTLRGAAAPLRGLTGVAARRVQLRSDYRNAVQVI